MLTDCNNRSIEEIKFWINKFNEIYSLKDYFFVDPNKSIKLGDKLNRICRYCNRDEKNTTFREKAHIFTNVISNQSLISYYECDKCNNLFSKYETDLSSFIGLAGYFESVDNYGIKKRRTFKLPKSDAEFYLSKKGMVIKDYKSEMLEEIEKNKVYKLSAIKTPYIPLNVYKSLVKIFLSILSDETLKSFNKAIKFLITDEYDDIKNVKIFCNLSYHYISDFYFEYPIIYIFQKNDIVQSDGNKKIIDKTFIIYFRNFIYQIFIPFDYEDKWFYENKSYKILLPYFPPIKASPKYFKSKSKVINNTFEIYEIYSHNEIDLSSKKKIKNEKDELYIQALIEPIMEEYTNDEYLKFIKEFGIKK